MNQALPDWMFAAFAIGGWEIFDLIARRWHMPNLRWAGGAIVAICILILVVRYVIRWMHRFRHPDTPDEDEWKQY